MDVEELREYYLMSQLSPVDIPSVFSPLDDQVEEEDEIRMKNVSRFFTFSSFLWHTHAHTKYVGIIKISLVHNIQFALLISLMFVWCNACAWISYTKSLPLLALQLPFCFANLIICKNLLYFQLSTSIPGTSSSIPPDEDSMDEK